MAAKAKSLWGVRREGEFKTFFYPQERRRGALEAQKNFFPSSDEQTLKLHRTLSLSFHERQTFLFSDILNLITFSLLLRGFSFFFFFFFFIYFISTDVLSQRALHFTDEQMKTFLPSLLLIFRLIFH